MNINEVITDDRIFSQFYILRDGYEFKPLTHPANIYDAIVIRNPGNIQRYFRIPKIKRSLSEHIELIKKLKLEKAIVFANDISFITLCPTLKYISIIPADDAFDNFDFSPLYDLPEIKSLECKTQYGLRDELTSSVDYKNISGLVDLSISGKGHLNYYQVDSLKSLRISNYQQNDLTKMFSSKILDSLLMIQCKIKTLDGIHQSDKMQCLYLDYNRSLQDISALALVKKTLRALRIENCPKIQDFSVLEELENLETLVLLGKNELTNISFIKKLKNLKTFVFSMTVLDGDLSPCLNLMYAYSQNNRKYYNLKNKDLPKKQFIRGNEDIEMWRRME